MKQSKGVFSTLRFFGLVTIVMFGLVSIIGTGGGGGGGDGGASHGSNLGLKDCEVRQFLTYEYEVNSEQSLDICMSVFIGPGSYTYTNGGKNDAEVYIYFTEPGDYKVTLTTGRQTRKCDDHIFPVSIDVSLYSTVNDSNERIFHVESDEWDDYEVYQDSTTITIDNASVNQEFYIRSKSRAEWYSRYHCLGEESIKENENARVNIEYLPLE